MKILAFILLVAGAAVGYGAKPIYENILKKECDEKKMAILKSVGLFVALLGAIIIFVIK